MSDTEERVKVNLTLPEYLEYYNDKRNSEKKLLEELFNAAHIKTSTVIDDVLDKYGSIKDAMIDLRKKKSDKPECRLLSLIQQIKRRMDFGREFTMREDTGINEVYAEAVKHLNSDNEEVIVVAYFNMMANKKLRILNIRTFTDYSEKTATVTIEKIIHFLPNNKCKVCIVHNHTNGDPEPSYADYRFTAQIRDELKAIGVELSGHLVYVSHEKYKLIDMDNISTDSIN